MNSKCGSHKEAMLLVLLCVVTAIVLPGQTFTTLATFNGTNGANPTRNLAIPRTTGMPHRPSSSDGHTSIFVPSNPTGRRYRLSRTARRYARLSHLPKASVRLPPKDGAAWILPNPNVYGLAPSWYPSGSTSIANPADRQEFALAR